MIQIDGSKGEGGGQVLRSSLALSMVTGQPFRISRIRAKRKRPGLMKQHLTGVQAARIVSQARVTGESLGSTELTFEPGQVTGGEFDIRIGTAGSTSLVLQTILPALLCVETASVIRLEGGTHNPFAPPFDFLDKAYFPVIAKLGPHVESQLSRTGFYPAGGGQVEFRVQPGPLLRSLEVLERGSLVDRRVRALLSHLPGHIGERECRTVLSRLDWPDACQQIVQLDNSYSPGNVLIVEVESESSTEVFTSFGEKGKPAHHVAREAVADVKRYLNSDAPVGEHLADQLMLPLAIGAWQGQGGGRFRTLDLTRHSRTHLDIIRQFLDVRIDVETQAPDNVVVRISP